MNAHENSTDQIDGATVAEIAALQFEPWRHDPDRWSPPTREDWPTKQAVIFMIVSHAYRQMFLSKDDLMKNMSGWNEEHWDVVMRGFIETGDFLRNALVVIEGAEARIMAAGCALEQDEEAA